VQEHYSPLAVFAVCRQIWVLAMFSVIDFSHRELFLCCFHLGFAAPVCSGLLLPLGRGRIPSQQQPPGQIFVPCSSRAQVKLSRTGPSSFSSLSCRVITALANGLDCGYCSVCCCSLCVSRSYLKPPDQRLEFSSSILFFVHGFFVTHMRCSIKFV
jgi:hypothetical protein